ncbi:unnamed protein product [Mesocestoides corti]|uniref:BRCA1-associated protein n=2 Tax=Mesocestoides corti TaxID=53468 RepID=A0A0R3U7E6_MESCO|nr:unnamed protein product [Mesocestoides corti]
MAEDIKFVSGNPLVEQTEGIIHFFTKSTIICTHRSSKKSSDSIQTSEMLCMLGIPCSIAVKDLLVFISPMRFLLVWFTNFFLYSKGITEVKIVKCHLIGHYMALIKFKTTTDADQFYATFNGSNFNSFEPDVCQLTYVSHVEAISTSSGGSSSSHGASFPLKGLVELPSCPVCLEKLDEPVAGILTTILCNHSFHDECISKTTDTVCPVCRYAQSPDVQIDSQCADCDLRDNLWICLICGNLGCGRYGHKHAYFHYKKTGHTFALEMGKNLVWDYADDTYVHRIAVNQEDGKIVQVGEGSETGDKKTDYLSMEFSAVLVSQLESQRQYFESQLEVITSESAARISSIESELDNTKRCVSNLESKLASVTKEKNSLSQKLAQSNATIQNLQMQLSENTALVSGLSSSQAVWEARAKKAEEELKQSNEELKELMLNLEFRDKLAEATAANEITEQELANSSVTVTESKRCRRRRKNR